ncbi:hypothetical protein Acr_00g0048030 [Actinidia rufa]|uniref:Uncharacterized protein n=1 Tax=Actinidia rufa TaxID=165716 RepID=A0A7J0DLU7_9ERIC|nr:hypothetical protein Acr_00g0048030 [Actinidia rufa]
MEERKEIKNRDSQLSYGCIGSFNPCFSVVIALSLLSNDNSELTIALAWRAIIFGSDYFKLRCGRPPSLLYSDNLVEITTLVRPVLEYPHLVPAEFELSCRISGLRIFSPRPSCFRDVFEAIGGSGSCPLSISSLVRAEAGAFVDLVRIFSPKLIIIGWASHGIPADVFIHRPKLNVVAIIVEVDTLMCLLDKPFSAKDLLHVYTVVRLKRELGNPFYTGNHYLCLRNPNQPQIGDDDLWSFLRRNDYLPDNFLDSKEEEEEDFSQLFLNKNRDRVTLAVKPVHAISILSSDNKQPNNLVHTSPRSVGEVKVVPSFRETNSSGDSSCKADTMMFKNLKKKVTPAAELPSVTTPPSAKSLSKWDEGHISKDKEDGRKNELGCHDRALKAQVLLLRARLQRASIFVDHMKKQSIKLKRAKKKARDASYATVIKAQNKVVAIEAALAELQLEYMNWPEEDEDVANAVVAHGNDIANLTEEAPGIVVEGSGEEKH